MMFHFCRMILSIQHLFYYVFFEVIVLFLKTHPIIYILNGINNCYILHWLVGYWQRVSEIFVLLVWSLRLNERTSSCFFMTDITNSIVTLTNVLPFVEKFWWIFQFLHAYAINHGDNWLLFPVVFADCHILRFSYWLLRIKLKTNLFNAYSRQGNKLKVTIPLQIRSMLWVEIPRRQYKTSWNDLYDLWIIVLRLGAYFVKFPTT